MTLAEGIAHDVIKLTGINCSPRESAWWESAVLLAQHRINAEMDRMQRLAGQDAIPSKKKCLEYEVFSRWWMGLFTWWPLDTFLSAYFARFTRKKYARYMAYLERRKKFGDE